MIYTCLNQYMIVETVNLTVYWYYLETGHHGITSLSNFFQWLGRNKGKKLR